jgi:hypothetical protein
VAKPSEQTVTLELHGAHATGGIELDSLERFIDKFRDALRDFERSSSARGHEVKRGGHPDARSIAATSFRLVGYRVGSAVLELADAAIPPETESLPIAAPGAATQNLDALMDGIDDGDLEPAVVDSLDEARRALGEDGRFSLRLAKRKRVAHVDSRTIRRLREAKHELPAPVTVTVFGRLHLISTEAPRPRVEIRATDNYNWVCLYDVDMEAKVLPLISKRVWARGLGTRERANRGTLKLSDIGALPEYEATPLFTYEAVPTEDLEREQGLPGPQGLGALGIADEADDDLDRFLAVMLED